MELSINKLKNVLEASGFIVKESRKSDHLHHKQLYCLRQKDQLDWNQAFIIKIDTKIFHNPISESKVKNLTEKVVEFLFIYPFIVEDSAISEMGRYLLLIDKTLEDQGFGLSEADRVVYFRNRRYIFDGQLETYLFLDFIGTNLLLIDSFKEGIEAIANGSKSLTEVLNSQSLKIA